MPSNILRNILEQKIDVFANTFGDGANGLFKKNDRLIHPLEYGMYKERCAKELLSFVVNKDIGISDGFLITSKNSVSTQCDIVMYKNNSMSIIDNGITNFYPIEIVKGIGEIKSTLDKSDFTKALVKLAKNKMLLEERTNKITHKYSNIQEFNEVFSFLICNKFSFDIAKVDFNEIYEEIPDIKYRHNAVLSLQDGLLVYQWNIQEMPEQQKKDFLGRGGNINATPKLWYHPHHTMFNERQVCHNYFIKIQDDDKYFHIIEFLIAIRRLLESCSDYEIDLTEYLEVHIDDLFDI